MFNLYVTTSTGRTFKTLRSPYTNRTSAESTVRMQISPDFGTFREVSDFAKTVTAAPLGETVTHGASGISFRTVAAS